MVSRREDHRIRKGRIWIFSQHYLVSYTPACALWYTVMHWGIKDWAIVMDEKKDAPHIKLFSIDGISKVTYIWTNFHCFKYSLNHLLRLRQHQCKLISKLASFKASCSTAALLIARLHVPVWFH